jgi:hypothetical protein
MEVTGKLPSSTGGDASPSKGQGGYQGDMPARSVLSRGESLTPIILLVSSLITLSSFRPSARQQFMPALSCRPSAWLYARFLILSRVRGGRTRPPAAGPPL